MCVMLPPGARIPWCGRCKPGPRHHPFAPSLRPRRNLICREQDASFSLRELAFFERASKRMYSCATRHSAAFRSTRINTSQGSSKPCSRAALWSNVRVQEQPALAPSAAMTESENEPFPCLSAIMAVNTSCSFSIRSTSV